MMGTRYFLTVTCPKCGRVDDDVYYAPKCPCGHVFVVSLITIGLEELTGISHDEPNNLAEVKKICRKAAVEGKG